jgi:hypothetical protein
MVHADDPQRRLPAALTQGRVDGLKHAPRRVGGAGGIGVGQECQDAGWAVGQHAGGVHISERTRHRAGHQAEHLFRRLVVEGSYVAGGFQQQDAKRSTVAVRPCQLVFEDGTEEAAVEETRNPIDDVQGLRVRVVGPGATSVTKGSVRYQLGSASTAALGPLPPAAK